MDISIFSTGTNIILITQSIMHLPEKIILLQMEGKMGEKKIKLLNTQTNYNNIVTHRVCLLNKH